VSQPAASLTSRRRGRRSSARWLLIGVAAGAVGALAVAPLLYLTVRAGGAGASAVAILVSPLTGRLLLRTVGLAVGVLALALAVALPYAWLVTRSDLPGRRLWTVIGALPLLFPSYVAAFAFVSALGPAGPLGPLVGALGLPELGRGGSGALIVLALASYPYLFLPLVAALRRLDPALEETARTLGASRGTVLQRVVLPQLRPSLAGGGLLVVLYVLSDFGAVSMVGFNTFTLGIYDAYRALYDRSVAAVLGLALVALSLLPILLERRLAGRRFVQVARPPRPARPQALGWRRVPALVFVAGVAALAVGVPIVTVIGWARTSSAWLDAATWRPALHSLSLAAGAAFAALLLAMPVALWAVRRPGLPSRVAERLCWTGHALPGIVVALAWVFLATRTLPALYQTPVLLLTACAARFLPEALAPVTAGLARVPPSMEEAARALGRGPLAALREVVLPALRPALAAAFALVFLSTMKELPATLLLRPTGFETLATRVWSAASEGLYSAAAAPALILVLASALPIGILVLRPLAAGGGDAR
jgi:iron(III) transport system permease protein